MNVVMSLKQTGRKHSVQMNANRKAVAKPEKNIK
jgi:hypothetical protein